MSKVRLLVGTRKGAFVMTSDGKREKWDVSGPHFGGCEIYHLKASPADPNRLYASQSSSWFGQVIQRSNDGGQTWEAMGNKFTFVRELVAHRLPGLATIVRALDHLPEPAAGLRGIEPIRIGGRGLEMIDLPAAEVWAAHVPLLALAVRRHDERAFARADQHPYLAHLSSFLGLAPLVSENSSRPTISPDRPISLTARIHGLPVHCLVEWTRAGST